MEGKIELFLSFLLLTLPQPQPRPTIIAQQPQGRKLDERHTSEFRYIIVERKVRNDLKNEQRDVVVLLDESAFSESNLRKLFDLVSRRFRRPGRLFVDVYTSLWDVPTPEETDGGSISGRGYDPHDGQHPRAILMRIEGNELFRYTADSGPPYGRLKTVVLRGRDPFNPAKE